MNYTFIKDIRTLSKRWPGMLLLLLAILVQAAACSDDEDLTVSASIEEMVVGHQATNLSVTIRSNTNWTAGSDADWCTLSQTSGRGTTEVGVLFDANTSDISRTATITIKSDNGVISYIALTQAGVSETVVIVSPQTITVGPKPSYGNAFTVRTKHADAVVSAVVTGYTGYEGDWISNLTQAGNSGFGNSQTTRYTFDALENTDANERTATITVTVTFANISYTEEVVVIQNGLGSPVISTQTNVYFTHNQTEHLQSLWIEGGDQTNVRYECHITSAHSGTGDAGTPWLTEASVDATTGILSITALPNNHDDQREGDILVVAYRNNTVSKISIHVTQAGHLSPGISLPTSAVVHNSVGDSFTLALNPLNNSTITPVEANVDWITGLNVSTDGVLSYTISDYDGTHGEYREGIITLKASNGHANPVYYQISLRQYAPHSAGISMPSDVISHNYMTATDELFPLNALNGSTVELVGVSKNWVTVTPDDVTNTSLAYSLDQYNGAEGAFREAIITLKATNGHANPAYYYITVRQYAPNAPGVSLPVSIITHNDAETTGTLPINALNGSQVSVVDRPSWISSASITGNATLTYSLNAYSGSEGNFREGVITLKATNASADAAYYYITVRQYEPDAPSISLPVSLVTFNHMAISGVTLPITVQNGTTVTVVSKPSFVTTATTDNSALVYSLDAFNGAGGNYREGVITLRASNAHTDDAYYYITVRQYAPNAPGISLPVSNITHNAAEVSSATLAFNTLNNASVSLINTHDSWLTVKSVNNLGMNYFLDAYNGSAGNFRETVITLKATNNNVDAAYYYITVRQYAPNAPSISLPVNIVTFNYQSIDGVRMPLTVQNGTTVSVVSQPSFVTTATVNNDNELIYSLRSFDGTGGNFREGIITLKASNAHTDDAYYYITVRQYAPNAPGISLPVNIVTFNYQSIDDVIMPLTVQNGTTVSVVSKPSFVTTATVNNDNELIYSLGSFNGTGGNFREGIFTLKASNAHTDDAYYYITVRQYAPNAPGISLPVSTLTYNYGTINGATLPISVLNGSTVTVVSHPAWVTEASITDANTKLTYSLNSYNGAAGNFREGVITLKASNSYVDAVYYYITVRQYEPDAPAISNLPALLVENAPAGTYALPINLLNGASVASVSSTSPSWLSGRINGSNLEYTVGSFAANSGDMREGTLTLKVSSTTHSEVAYYYVCIRQVMDEAVITGIHHQTVTIASSVYTNIYYSVPTGYRVTATLTNSGNCNGGGTLLDQDNISVYSTYISLKRRDSDLSEPPAWKPATMVINVYNTNDVLVRSATVTINCSAINP